MNNDKFILWSEAHNLVLEIYKITNIYPVGETFGLVSQMRRCAVSIPSNISEGKARKSNKDYIRFLYISRGSLEELKYQLILSKDLTYIEKNEYDEIMRKADFVGKLLNGLINKLKSSG